MAHRSNTVYFGQPDASGQDGMGGGPVRVPVMYLGIPREGGGWGGEPGRELGGGVPLDLIPPDCIHKFFIIRRNFFILWSHNRILYFLHLCTVQCTVQYIVHTVQYVPIRNAG